MSAPIITTERQQRQIAELAALIADRAAREAAIPADHTERDRQIEQRQRDDRHAEKKRYESARQATQAAYDQAVAKAENKFDSRAMKVAADSDEAIAGIRGRFAKQQDQAKEVRNDIRAKSMAKFEREKKTPVARFARIKKQSGEQHEAIAALQAEGDALLAQRRIKVPSRPTAVEGTSGLDDVDAQSSGNTESATGPVGPTGPTFGDSMNRARELLTQNQHLLSARFIYEGWPVIMFFVFAVVGGAASWFAMGAAGWLTKLGAGVGGGLVANLILTGLVWSMARGKILKLHGEFCQQLVNAARAVDDNLNHAKDQQEPQFEALVAERNEAITTADAKCKELIAGYEQERDEALEKVNTTADQQDRENKTWHDRKLTEIHQEYPRRLGELKTEHEQNLAALDQRKEDELAQSQQLRDQQWQQLVDDWAAGIAHWQAMVDEMGSFAEQRFPDWGEIDFADFQAAADAPPAIRIGQTFVGMSQFPAGTSTHEDLAVQQTEFVLPTLLSFPDAPSLLIKAEDDAREDAVRVMQNAMLRLLVAMPPGKVRLTIIDPTGRGQNFSAFMHLTDYDDQLVTSRIWTEGNHIKQRLTDITEHMENVIQKYLRNEFESIQQYNEQAGEVAEAYRVLVVANFPAGFSDDSVKRLTSIANSGARCGVSTLISVDTKEAAKRKLDLTDLQSHALTLAAQGEDQFAIEDKPLDQFPVQIDSPPDDATFTAAVRAVGQAAEDSSRVEVPFASITPEEGNWWTSDSRGEIEVPLGRAGATKLQTMKLGRGTSQHVLIAGKTGSGKSTLLNAMITNLATHYSPSELEFYLIDFKKGVEFKPYATYKLPQAKVIAIESEREFGLSVLQRLDEELKRRGDLFRKVGVQDVKAWRDGQDEPMPRILLIVDEFQELFVADDRVARDAGLLLDRLVRQGRAFGIHVMLGTQTLAGAYSLARSTIGQMAVRIALQCSESDAHLILSEDNTAARLLNRPGAAIYNDANGLIEGNHPFQVVWLPDHERESYLREIQSLAASRNGSAPPPIVFEGNVPSDPAENHELSQLIASASTNSEPRPSGSGPDDQYQRPRLPQAWLGASVAIKEPTFVSFDRHSGSNLLLVGQHEELAAGMLTTATVALGAHTVGPVGPTGPEAGENLESVSVQATGPVRRTGPTFLILDGTRPDELTAGLWRRTAKALGDLAEVFDVRHAPDAIAAAAAELARRTEADDDTAAPWYVVVFNLSRFRNLQRSGDDFGFTNFGEEEKVDAGKQFADLLRDGPAVGMHTLIWCDSYNNVNRWIDRQSLRDLELRVLLQMSASDSANLIDSPAASQLGVNRAVLYNDERGEYEKFRPYGVPEDGWLASVRKALAGGREVIAAESTEPEAARGPLAPG